MSYKHYLLLNHPNTPHEYEYYHIRKYNIIELEF